MEDTSIRLYEESKTPLTLELAGSHREEGKESPRKVHVSIDRINKDKLGNEKILVGFPPVMDTAHAGVAVDLLLDRWDTTYHTLHTLILTGLRFTQGGINAVTTFLGMQNVVTSVEQVVLRDVIGGKTIMKDDEDAVYSLCKSLRAAPNLERIDLSHNVIGRYVWEALGKQVKLKHLCLAGVEMNDSSVEELRFIFGCGSTLQSFTISNRKQTGPMACKSIDMMLNTCRNLRSFVWEQTSREKPQENLPLSGLARLSKNMFKNDFNFMTHLELSGGIVPADPTLLCNALEGFHKLQFLKISRAHLKSEKIQRIVTALRSARPPLATIDFSYNQIDCEGAAWIAQLSCLRAVTKNLKLLNLEHNRIAQKGAMEVVESFAPKSSGFNLQMNGNDFDPCNMFLKLASSKHSAETELKDLRKDCSRLRAEKMDAQNNLREMLSAQSTMINDMHELQSKAKQLEEDKKTLVKAFSVLGMMQHVEERDNILTRLAELEEAVHGKSPHKNGVKKGNTKPRRASSPTRINPEPTGLSRKAGKADSFDDVPPSSRSRSTSRNVSRTSSFDEAEGPFTSNNASLATTTHTNNRTRSPRTAGRPGTARHLMVKAASERWKSLLKTDPNSGQGQSERKIPIHKPQRAKSNKSLAEFLNQSAPDVLVSDGGRAVMLEDDSIQTTPGPSTSMGAARRRIRQGGSSRSLQQGGSSRSLQSEGGSSSSAAASRSLPPRDESKSLPHAPPSPLPRSETSSPVPQNVLRDVHVPHPPHAMPLLDKMHASFSSQASDNSSEDYARRKPVDFGESVPNLYGF